MVSVLFFGRLKEELQCAQMELELSASVSVSQLKQLLVSNHESWHGLLSDDQVLVAVDQVMATLITEVPVDAEVAFFPPVTGG